MRIGDFLTGAAETSEDLHNGTRFSKKIIQQSRPAIKNRLTLEPLSEQLARMPEAVLPKVMRQTTKPSVQIIRW